MNPIGDHDNKLQSRRSSPIDVKIPVADNKKLLLCFNCLCHLCCGAGLFLSVDFILIPFNWEGRQSSPSVLPVPGGYQKSKPKALLCFLVVNHISMCILWVCQ